MEKVKKGIKGRFYMRYKAKKDMKYIENDAEYAAKAKSIKAEDIGRMFQDRVEMEMPNLENILLQIGIKATKT